MVYAVTAQQLFHSFQIQLSILRAVDHFAQLEMDFITVKFFCQMD
jgi:hypothetical protein